MSYQDDLADFEQKVVDLAKFLSTVTPDKRVLVTAEVRRRLFVLGRALGEQLDDAVYDFVMEYNDGTDDKSYRRDLALEEAKHLIDRGVRNHSPLREIQDRPNQTMPTEAAMLGHYERGETRAKNKIRQAKWVAEHDAKVEADRQKAVEDCAAALTEAAGYSIFDVDTGHRIGPATVEQVEALGKVADLATVVNGFKVPRPTAEVPILIYARPSENPHYPSQAIQTAVGRVSNVGWHYQLEKVRSKGKVVCKYTDPYVSDSERAVFVRRNELASVNSTEEKE